LLAELGRFQFTPLERSVAELYEYYRSIRGSLDVQTVVQDPYLDYAKNLRAKFFNKGQIKAKRNKIVQEDLEYITGQAIGWEKLRGKTVLIAGAAGFLPSYLAETLLYLNESRGLKIKVIGLVRDLAKAQQRFVYYQDRSDLELIQADICGHFEVKSKVDQIIHAASQATPKVFKSDPIGTLLPNVVGTANLLDLAVKKKVAGFLYFSSSGVYGRVEPEAYPIKEHNFGSLDPTDLASCYLESKRMGENMCIAWHSQFGIPVKIVRPAITYGPGIKLDDGRSFADFVSDIVHGRDITLYSEGKVIRNYCYIADATLGFFTVMLKGVEGEAYNVATDQEITVRGLADKLANEVFPEKKLKVVMKKDPQREYLRIDFPRTAVDICKLKALGWELNFPVELGFKRTVESYVQ